MNDEIYTSMNDYRDYLAHYGVKGMHWGIRRYQPYSVNPRKGGLKGRFLGKMNKTKRYLKNVDGRRLGKKVGYKVRDTGVDVAKGAVRAGIYSLTLASAFGAINAGREAYRFMKMDQSPEALVAFGNNAMKTVPRAVKTGAAVGLGLATARNVKRHKKLQQKRWNKRAARAEKRLNKAMSDSKMLNEKKKK